MCDAVWQACFALSNVFKGWGNNEANVLPWMVRLCKYTQRMDVAAVVAAISREGVECDADAVADTLMGMQQKATERLERLRDEHGVAIVDAL